MSLMRPRSDEAGNAAKACSHCGTRFRPAEPDDAFCCSGCEYVHRLIREESLDRYYDLRGGVAQPVGPTVFAGSDFAWLEPLKQEAESRGELASTTLALEGVSCVGCVWLIDRLFAVFEGGVSCRVNVQYGTIDLSWKSGLFDLEAFAERLRRFGYRVCPAKAVRSSETRQVAWRLGLCGAFALNGMLYSLPRYLGMESGFAFAPHFDWLSSIFASLSMLVGGSYFIGKAFRAALQGITHLDLPISLGIVMAYAASWLGMFRGTQELVYFDFVSTFVFLMLAGRWLQIVAVERNRNRLADIAIEAPQVEVEGGDGRREKRSAELLKSGDVYWIASGQRVPTHGLLRSPRASLGLDWISGETMSRLVEQGQEVPSGAELESQFAIKVEASEDWGDSLMARLARSETRSEERDAATQRVIFWYMAIALGVAALGGLAWLFHGGLTMGLMVFIAILVVSCPCALGVAWPFADEIALMRLKRKGVFVTSHSIWTRLSQVKQVVFDKTGTLTRSSLSLLNPEVLDELDASSLLALATLCSRSRHPVARAVRERLMAKGKWAPRSSGDAGEEIGLGLRMEDDGRSWRLGRGEWATGQVDWSGKTVFACDGRVLASLEFADQPFSDAGLELAALRRSGLGLAILSGDQQEKVWRVADLLGLDREVAWGGLLPEGKADWLRLNDGRRSLMVGDGANDTLAFGEALCCGAPANEQGIVAGRADFHYLGSGIQGVRDLLQTGKQRRRAVRRLVAFAICYNVAAVGVALLGVMTPLLAAILMPLSSIVSLALVWLALGAKTKAA